MIGTWISFFQLRFTEVKRQKYGQYCYDIELLTYNTSRTYFTTGTIGNLVLKDVPLNLR